MSELKPSEKPLYVERVLPNWATFSSFTLLLPAIMLVSEPFDIRIGIVVGSLVVLGIWLALFMTAPVIWVSELDVKAGAARIPRQLLGEIKEVSAQEIFAERGPNLNPLAYKVFQGTVKSAVKIFIKDENDPTPYWLVSTRRPAQLAQILRDHNLEA